MDKKELAQDMRIDSLGLDIDCLEQPELYFKWSERAAVAKTEAEEAKDAVELNQAQAEIAIRGEPGRFGLTKVTDSSVKAAVIAHPSVVSAKKHWADAKKHAGSLQAAERSMEQRKRMLSNMVTLFSNQYFAAPSTGPRDLGKAHKARTAAREEALYDRQKKAVRKRKKK